jgi:single-stranded DNA-binding protein
MIDALISGRLHRAPQSRTSKSGKPFATASVRCSLRDGGTVFASVIAFDSKAVTALLALSDGDSVALAGELTPKVYTPANGGEPRPSLDLLAHAVLTEYHVARKRKAMQDAGDGRHREPEEAPFDEGVPDMRRGAR